MATYNLPEDVLKKLKRDWIPGHSPGTAYVATGVMEINYGKGDIRKEQKWDIRTYESDARDCVSGLENIAIYEATSRVTQTKKYLMGIRKLPNRK